MLNSSLKLFLTNSSFQRPVEKRNPLEGKTGKYKAERALHIELIWADKSLLYFRFGCPSEGIFKLKEFQYLLSKWWNTDKYIARIGIHYRVL